MSLLDKVLGKPLASSEEESEKIGTLAGLPTLGLDGLSSAAYGPEAALTILIPLGAAGLAYIGPIILVILVLLTLLYFSYRQTIAAYTQKGGSYTVASENLGRNMGLLAAAALMLDYILNVAVGISAGVGQLASAVPSLQAHTLALCLVTLVLITVVNLRGIGTPGVAFGVPTYLFVVTLFVVLATGTAAALEGHHTTPVIAPPPLHSPVQAVGIWLLLRAFASGCTAMTGVEAVSNGVKAFAEPAVEKAHRTLTAIVVILAILLAGIAYLSHVYNVGAMDQTQPGYQSVISQLVAAVFGKGLFYYVTIGSVLAVLALSANTSFADFPRLCGLVANDSYLPHAFAKQGRRLVHSMGILILGGISGLLLIIFGGITDRLIPLFAVGAFSAFTLSQAGMVVHWRRKRDRGSALTQWVNGVGAVATAVALAVILMAKFREGAWITVLLIPLLFLAFRGVKRHYDLVSRTVNQSDPMDLRNVSPPLVLVPVGSWNLITERALRFALRISPDVTAIHFIFAENEGEDFREEWAKNVEQPIKTTKISEPRLEVILSPFREILKPLLSYIEQMQKEHPTRLVAVVIPELVETQWHQRLLHNHEATWLKAGLLLYGNEKIVVINVPWYLHEKRGRSRTR